MFTRYSQKIFILFCLAIFTGFSTGCRKEEPLGPKKSFLFIGNSFTNVNDLPGTFAHLALSGGHPVTTAMIAPGSYKLFQHAATEATMNTIANQKWDYVILQEQSQTPAKETWRTNEMYPAVRLFNGKIRQSGAKPILYMTWGRKNGCPEMGFSDYHSMQEELRLGYLGIANELGIEVAPVGEAWKNSVENRPALELWASDGIHPSPAGTYLAACVFYAVIYNKSPEGLKYKANLQDDDAGFLQRIAAETVLTDLKHWNIQPETGQ
jgi:hypothetical protein